MNRLTQILIVLSVFCPATTSSAMLQSPEGKIKTFTISGSTGINGARMTGLPGEPVTDQNGYYSVVVENGWSGTVTPAKEGYMFRPACKIYKNVTSDLTSEDYAVEIIRYTISGRVIMAPGTFQRPPLLPGVVMQGLPDNPVTDEAGSYTSTVEYGWAGTVNPEKEGYTFNPPQLSYTKVMKDQKNQNYTAEQLSQEQWQYGRGSSRRVTRTAGFQPVDSRKVLVVPSAEVNPKDLAEIIEDMQIMSHILDERFKETRRVQGVFTDFGDFFGRDNRQTEATYLQGYGVLFSMEVNFAFSPQPKQQQQQAEQSTEPVDSTWERAKQQMLSPRDSRGAGGPDSTDESGSQMVEELKRDLITTLKHAANIRGAQPDEWIILTVIGSGRQAGGGFGGGGFMMGGMGGMYGGSSYGGTTSGGTGGFGGGYRVSGSSSGYRSGMIGGMGGGMMGGMGGFSDPSVFSEMGVSPATVLTIRAKKSDIDAYAKDEQLAEQFRRQVQIFTY